jgi:adenylate cyclase
MALSEIELTQWIVKQGMQGTSLAALLGEVSQKLADRGMRLCRSYVALPTVNPLFRVVNCTWRPENGAVLETIGHEQSPVDFDASPFGLMLREGQEYRRWQLEKPDGDGGFDILASLKQNGATDYVACLFSFQNADAPSLQGLVASFTTDRPGGFTDEEIGLLERISPLIAVAAYRIALLDLAADMLDTYIGLSAGRRVLSGEIRRGVGQTIYAALMFADLRGFTSLADTMPAERLIGRLDEHFDAMAEPVTARGGEVLKFMGDGLLAVFQIETEGSPADACAAAVAAATEALSRNAQVNDSHAGEPRLDLDIGLHLGEVFYGNIGSGSRLDFTVIGPAVNEASRMEALCGMLGTSLIFSKHFAKASGQSVRSLGHHALRGLCDERELFTLA